MTKIAKQQRSVLPPLLARTVRRVLLRIAVKGPVQIPAGTRVGFGARVSSLHGLRVGAGVAIGPRSVIEVDGSIGDFVMIGRNVQIVGRVDHDISEIGVPMIHATWIGDREASDRDRVSIGRDVWIGASSVILSGVSIGEGAVVAAGAVVVKDVNSYSIVGGNPARELRRRFELDDEILRHRRGLDSFGKEHGIT